MTYFEPTAEQRAQVIATLEDVPYPSVQSENVVPLLQHYPDACPTPLVTSVKLAKRAGVETVCVKDERGRLGLGSFKALGAAYVIACDAAKGDAARQTYVSASAGNHGLSVAAGAAKFGARAVIFLAASVPEAFADRLRAIGAEVRRAGAI